MHKSAHGGIESRIAIFGRKHKVLRLLRSQTHISLGGGALVVEVGEGGHTERLVPRSGQQPVRIEAIRHVHARIPAEARVECRVHVSHHAHRYGHSAQQHIVLGKVADIGAIVALVVEHIFARHFHIFRLLKRATEIG